jgi:hypothetical protein
VALEETDESVQDNKGEGAEGETHNSSGTESNVEAIGPTGRSALNGTQSATSVGESGDEHSNVAGEEGGETTNSERKSGQTTNIPLVNILNLGGETEDDEGEKNDEDGAKGVFGEQESVGTSLHSLVTLEKGHIGVLVVLGQTRALVGSGAVNLDGSNLRVLEEGEQET